MANVKTEPRIYIYTSCVYLDRRETLFVHGKVAAKNIFVHHHHLFIYTRGSAIEEGPRDAHCQLKPCQLLQQLDEKSPFEKVCKR